MRVSSVGGADEDAKEQFLKEFNLMKSLMPALLSENNRNVVRLLGGCMNEGKAVRNYFFDLIQHGKSQF